MRILSVALAITCVACSSSTGLNDRAGGTKPGPSMTGQWYATDTLQRLLQLSLTQTGDTVRSNGFVVTGASIIDSGTVVGVNVIRPPCCGADGVCPSPSPCPLAFAVSLTLVDAAGNHLNVNGGFDGTNTNRFVVQGSDQSPNFPFYFVTQPTLRLAFTRQPQNLQQRTGLGH
jgi:hypothetical protein